jgi:hypothetical protein
MWIPVGARLTDDMTNLPLSMDRDRQLPIVLVKGQRAFVQLHRDPYHVPAPPEGWTYLIAPARAEEVEAQIRRQQDPKADGGWRLRVQPLEGQKQHIELNWVDDGYSGAVYEATATSVRPLYWKSTGPGYAFIFGGVAFLLNVLSWSPVVLVLWIYFGRSRMSRASPA